MEVLTSSVLARREQAQAVQALACSLGAELVETHGAWFLLADDDAYKVRKAVSTRNPRFIPLDERGKLCRAEVRLNTTLSGDLYRGVVSICGTPSHPVIAAGGEPLDFAVHMRRMPPEAFAANRVAAGELSVHDIDAIAAMLSRFHAQAPRAPAGERHGSVVRRMAVAATALSALGNVIAQAPYRRLSEWLESEGQALAPLWASRREQGLVRECHGDLHLGNLLLLPSGPAAFDAEAEPDFRCIDVLDDIAMPVMDLCAAGRNDLAFRLLNHWLDATGDHAALPALRFSIVYRALARAQVTLLHGTGRRPRARRYVSTALDWIEPQRLQLTITHGAPASGKTAVSQQLLQQQGAICIRHHPVALAAAQDRTVEAGQVAAPRSYRQLYTLARTALEAGYPVVLDAPFLGREEREAVRKLAQQAHAQFAIAACLPPGASDGAAAAQEPPRGEPFTSSELGFVQRYCVRRA
jgi:aminoglycoside phosphotransferase family enzyme